jgi:hypothetical protein
VNPLLLSADAGTIVAADAQQWGARDVETGGFLLAPAGTNTITTIALAGRRGIHRDRLRLQFSGDAFDALAEWAEAHHLRVRAQFHSHQHGAFLSPIDRSGGMRVHGFITTVLPTFANPPFDPTAWGWWRFDTRDWQPCPSAAPADLHATRTVVFDEDGTRG